MSGRNTPTSHCYYMFIGGKSQTILTAKEKTESTLSTPCFCERSELALAARSCKYKRAKAFAGGNQKHNKRCCLRVRVSAIENIGCQRKDRHKWFVGKFHKQKNATCISTGRRCLSQHYLRLPPYRSPTGAPGLRSRRYYMLCM